MAENFLNQNYLLASETAENLYHGLAKALPIIDYHNHLSPNDIADNRLYENLTQVWLAGDHYKWRAMRWAGVDEALITGEADDWAKFHAWAKIVPLLLRNPLYAWTHMELQRFFGIDLLLNADTAKEIWEETQGQLKQLPILGMLDRYRVAILGTSDDPALPLTHHQKMAANQATPLKMIPSFCLDAAHLGSADPAAWQTWLRNLTQTTGVEVRSYDQFLEALHAAHETFHAAGARVSDHRLSHLPDSESHPSLARQAIQKLLKGELPDTSESDSLTLEVLHAVADWNHARSWTMRLHLNPLRNVNRRLHQLVGADAGRAVMGEEKQGNGLARFLARQDEHDRLPQMILSNLNPADNDLFAVLAGAFQGTGRCAGHVQWGSAWWFSDQEQGIRRHLDDLSNYGLLSTFVGMLTDSHSPLSFVRHEMFRRILCDVIGHDAESGRIPQDLPMLQDLVRRVCFDNSKNYFGFSLHPNFT